MQDPAIYPIVQLLLAAQDGSITAEQQQQLDAWGRTAPERQAFVDKCRNGDLVAADLEKLDAINSEAAWGRFAAQQGFDMTPVVPMRKRAVWRWLVAAAIAGVMVTAGVWWMNRTPHAVTPPVATTTPATNDIAPGSRKATLTLADGRQVELDDQHNGTLAQEGGAMANKQGQELVYNNDPAKAEAVVYHTTSTPTGGYFTLVLADQTKVWLNAESSIRYPTAFTGPERRVEITGEAYFEVAKNAKQPFIVSVKDKDLDIKVLGTHFNVNAYADLANMRTTLLEGKVEVSQGGHKATLAPGQAAVVSSESLKSPHLLRQGSGGQAIQVKTVDVSESVAWKDGNFSFHSAEFADVMKEIKRWYVGIESVEIKAPVRDQFTATIPRSMSLANMLKILEEVNNVHFTIEGKKIIVVP